MADLGMLIARTDPELPKHQGITWFAFDMHQNGVEVRPLVEMTGHAMFNEVFISDGVVGDDAIIGGRGNGWAVANTTLMHERSGLGSGGGSAAAGAATPGTIADQLGKRAGDFVSAPEEASLRPVGCRRGHRRRRGEAADRPGQGQRRRSRTPRSART